MVGGDYMLKVGDKIHFKFDENGGVQERIIVLIGGKICAIDTELWCACHVTDTLKEMYEKYNQFNDCWVIKNKRKGEMK